MPDATAELAPPLEPPGVRRQVAFRHLARRDLARRDRPGDLDGGPAPELIVRAWSHRQLPSPGAPAAACGRRLRSAYSLTFTGGSRSYTGAGPAASARP